MLTLKPLVSVVIASLALVGESQQPPSVPSHSNNDNKPIRLADQYSSSCATSTGICSVAPQPVGSKCTCPDGTYGTIVP